MDGEMERHGRKMWAISANVTRKQERRKARTERRKLERQLSKLKAERDRGRKKWDWKHRVFSVEVVVGIAFSIVTLKAIEILAIHLQQ